MPASDMWHVSGVPVPEPLSLLDFNCSAHYRSVNGKYGPGGDGVRGFRVPPSRFGFQFFYSMCLLDPGRLVLRVDREVVLW